MKIERIGDEHYQLGESPIWDPQQNLLYFVDSMAGSVHCYDPQTRYTRCWNIDCEYLGSLALRTNGGAILVMDKGFYNFDFASGKTSVITEPEHGRHDICFNDCKVDRQGRLIAGSMHIGSSEAIGSVYRLDSDLSCTRLDGGMVCPNGPCWSLDDKIMYLSDSYGDAIFAYDYDSARGELSNRRTFISTADSGGYPDGGTVDAEGFIWSAHFDSGSIRRIDPAGAIDRVIELPVQWVASLTFGGADHDTLYVTTIGGEYDGERDTSADAGALFAISELGTKGLPEPRFAG